MQWESCRSRTSGHKPTFTRAANAHEKRYHGGTGRGQAVPHRDQRQAPETAAPRAAGPLSVSDAARAVVCQPLLETLRLGSAAWDRLLERSPAASPFASWAWHWAWAHSAPPDDLNASYAVLTATNINIPLSNWVSIKTNQFGSAGEFSFTNGIPPGEPQRYFRIRTP